MKSPVVTIHDALKKFVAFDSIPVQNCEDMFYSLKFVLLCSKQGSQRAQTFHHLLDHSLPYSNLSCHFYNSCALVLCDDLINFFFSPLSRGSLQATL